MVGRLADRVEGAVLVDQMAATVTVVNLETQEKRESDGLVASEENEKKWRCGEAQRESERSCSRNTVR